MISFVLVIFATLAFTWYVWGANRRPKNFPPGPAGIPIFGNALQVGKEGFKTALTLQKTYGDIIGLRIGSRWTVYLNNPDDIREAFSKPEFSGRTGFNFLMETDCDEFNSGILFNQGRKWFDHRRFSVRTLREFGFGKKTSEGIILEEAKDLILRLKKMEGKPFSTHEFFNASTFSITWSIVAGERYDPDDLAMEKLMKALYNYFSRLFSDIQILFGLFPGLLKLRKTFPTLFRGQRDKFREELLAFFKITVDNHRKTMQLGQPRDYIDALLEESSNIEGFEEMDMETTLLDFFVAGSETSTTALMWGFFLLAQYPEVQEKFATEIQSVVGHCEVTVADKLRLPYVEATIMEIMRLSNIAPVGLPHATTCDVVFKGLFFPKGTTVFANLYGCLMSPDIWGDPKVFRPERFLSSDGKTLVRNKAWIPFSVGKRSCLGESLARDEVYLFLTNLIHNLHVTMPEDEPLHSLEGLLHGSLVPESHRVLVNSRY